MVAPDLLWHAPCPSAALRARIACLTRHPPGAGMRSLNPITLRSLDFTTPDEYAAMEEEARAMEERIRRLEVLEQSILERENKVSEISKLAELQAMLLQARLLADAAGYGPAFFTLQHLLAELARRGPQGLSNCHWHW